MAAIRLDSLTKTYPNGVAAVRDLSLEAADGELLVLVGPSGCGKTTTLRLLAGLERPSSGRVWIGDRDVTDLPPRRRDVAMVFQNYALYPHLTVRQNLEFALRLRGIAWMEREARVNRTAAALGLEELLSRRPAELSGGQRQRVALGRAIVRQPQAFLLDEPLSNLDPQLRVQTRAELARLHRQLGATMLYVTHDQEEALTLGDRVAVLRDGRLQQVAAPLEVYRRPANVFVAGFVGSPAMNFFDATPDGGRLVTPWFALPIVGVQAGKEVQMGIRPQDVRLVSIEEADVLARVDVLQPLGSALVLHLRLGEPGGEKTVTAVLPAETAVAEDQQVGLQFPRDRLHLFDRRDGHRSIESA